MVPKLKKIIFVICYCTLVHFAFGQVKNKLLGQWQANMPEVTSMYHDTYHFYSNGKFDFKPDGYNGLNRIININGIFKIKGDTLFLTPEFTEEVFGGSLCRSESTTLSDTWEIVGGRQLKVPTKKKTKQSAIIKMSPDNKTFTLDDRKFFKVAE